MKNQYHPGKKAASNCGKKKPKEIELSTKSLELGICKVWAGNIDKSKYNSIKVIHEMTIPKEVYDL